MLIYHSVSGLLWRMAKQSQEIAVIYSWSI